MSQRLITALYRTLTIAGIAITLVFINYYLYEPTALSRYEAYLTIIVAYLLEELLYKRCKR
jgi:hypothetical protein